MQTKIHTLRTAIGIKIVIWGSVLWVSAVLCAALYAAPAVRALPSGGTVAVVFGPLPLLHVTKTVVTAGGGFTLAFGLERGIAVLGIACMAVESGLVVLIPQLIRRHTQKSIVHRVKK